MKKMDNVLELEIYPSGWLDFNLGRELYVGVDLKAVVVVVLAVATIKFIAPRIRKARRITRR
jgi:hypothetical protein